MSSGITEEEFAGFQTQLLILREQKYAADETKLKALERAKMMENKMRELDAHNQRLQLIINKNKTTKDFELLYRENEVLRDRLSGIESNFVLQMNTLQQECSSLMTENDTLRASLDRYQSIGRGFVAAEPLGNHHNANSTAEKTAEETSPATNNDAQHCQSCENLSKQSLSLLTELNDCKADLARKEEELTKFKGDVEIQKQQSQRAMAELAENHRKKLDQQLEQAKADYSKLLTTHQEEKATLQDLIASREGSVTLLTNELQAKTTFFQTEMSKLNSRVEEERNAFAARLDSFQEQKDQEIKVFSDKYQTKLKTLEWELSALKEEKQQLTDELQCVKLSLEQMQTEHANALTERSKAWETESQSLKELFTAQLEEKQLDMVSLKSQCEDRLAQKQLDVDKLRDIELQLRGDLRNQKRKYERQLKDLRRDLEKEMKRGDEMQSQLAENATTRSRQSIDDYLQTCRLTNGTVVPDDCSSVTSFNASSLVGGESVTGSLQNMPVYEADLTGVIERLVMVQDENCDLKRQVHTMQNDLLKLTDQVQRKDAIIQRYLSSRGAAEDEHKNLPGASSSHHRPTSISPDPTAMSSVTMLNNSLHKVLDHLKTKRLESLEFKQLKNICEELMTKNLHLEENLKMLVDRNQALERDLLTWSQRHGAETPT